MEKKDKDSKVISEKEDLINENDHEVSEEDLDNIIEERQNLIAKERGYEIIDHSMVLYVKPLKK